RSCPGGDECDCALGARAHAETARVARVGRVDRRLLPAVHDELQPREPREFGALLRRDDPELEHVVRAHLDAVRLALAPVAVDHGDRPTRLVVAAFERHAATSPLQPGTVSSIRMNDNSLRRARLLAAALEEFAARGPAGARVESIARSAGVNKQLIT